jgi:exopolysaccharide biosynthesis predicted pyruvyltransferase EpsI
MPGRAPKRLRSTGQGAHDPGADRDLITAIRKSIASTIQPLLTGDERCALVGFPNHNNSGDNAIWLGELRLLDQLGVEIAYQCDDASYRAEDLRRSLRSGPILIHGGGNYGDLWPEQQTFREQVMRDFPERRLIQLPQTVTFTSSASIGAHRRLLAERDEPMTILCRDTASADLVERELGEQPLLCADSAFFLNVAAPRPPSVDVLVNRRADHESITGETFDLAGLTVESKDWLPPPGERNLRRSVTVRSRTRARAVASSATSDGVYGRGLRRVPLIGARRFAQRRVAFACATLGRGRVVVTDRLHGHILSLLMGIPHVIRDTRHRKVAAFHQTFTDASRTTLLAEAPEDVPPLVRSLLDDPMSA